jgi:hypothetical protein
MLGGIVLLSVPCGCGPKVNYPKVMVTTSVGSPGVCYACKKKIDCVSEKNLYKNSGREVIVCDDKCAEKAKAKMDWEDGR